MSNLQVLYMVHFLIFACVNGLDSFHLGFNKNAYPLMQDTIDNAIEDSIMWPVRKVVPILPGEYRYANR